VSISAVVQLERFLSRSGRELVIDGMLVHLSVRPSVWHTLVLTQKGVPDVSSLWNLREIYASSEDLLLASINAPHLISKVFICILMLLLLLFGLLTHVFCLS